MSDTAQTWVPLAKIGRPIGLRGEVRLDLFNPDSKLVKRGLTVGVRIESKDVADKAPQVFRVIDAKEGAKFWRLKFEGLSSREDVKELTGRDLLVNRDDLPELDEGDFYACDLMGFTVVDLDGNHLGELKNILPTASNDILVIERKGEELMVPFHSQFVKDVSLAHRMITIEEPEVVDAF